MMKSASAEVRVRWTVRTKSRESERWMTLEERERLSVILAERGADHVIEPVKPWGIG